MANVMIKRRVAARNVDAFNRAVKCASAVENGAVFELNTRSTVDGEDEVWVATAIADDATTGVWMAYSSEVTTTVLGAGIAYELAMRGIVEDPRFFTNVANVTFDAFKPQAGDIIEMTLGAGATASADAAYLVIDEGAFNLKASAADNTTGFTMKKVDTGILHIGNAKLIKTPVRTVIYEVVRN